MPRNVRKHKNRSTVVSRTEEREATAKTKIPPGRFFKSKPWDNRQIELLLLGKGTPSYFVGDYEGLKANWADVLTFDSIYFGLNPSKVEVVDQNRIVSGSIGRKAETIVSINYLYLDVDPVRPGRVCATDEEKIKANTLKSKITHYLQASGFPDPWVFDSGNGYHLLYPCKLLTKDEGLNKRFLNFLADKFDTKDVKVDRAVGDLARVCRTPSTWNRKGFDAPDRPHRKSKIIRAPPDSDAKQFVTREMLTGLLGDAAKDRPSDRERSENEPMRPNVIARVSNYISKMPASVSGEGGHDKLFAAACKIVELGCNFHESQHVIEQAFNSRCVPPWSDKELQHKLDDAFEKCSSKEAERESRSTVMVKEHVDSSPEFIGYLSNFARFDIDVLDRFPMFGSEDICGNMFERFALMQFRKPRVVVPQEFIRQFYFPAHRQRNWRKRLLLKTPMNWHEIDSYRDRKAFDSCAFCHAGFKRHTHFELNIGSTQAMKEFLAVTRSDGTEVFADQVAEEYGGLGKAESSFIRHKKSAFSFKGTKRKQFTKCLEQGKFRLLYLPTLLLGTVAGLFRHEIRALLGITNELSGTKQEPRIISNAIVRKNRRTTKNGGMFCPILDPRKDYVVFGGNRRNGAGYQLFGDTNQGWIHRLGFWDAYKIKGRRQKSFRMKVAKFIFGSLFAELPQELQITVAAYNAGENQWKGLNDLQLACRSEAGFNWIDKSTIRFFAPADWCFQWRSYLSNQLGYSWIPATSSECAPATDPNFVTPSELRSFADSQGWKRDELASALSRVAGCSISKKTIQRHLSGKHQTPKFWRTATELLRSR